MMLLSDKENTVADGVKSMHISPSPTTNLCKCGKKHNGYLVYIRLQSNHIVTTHSP